MQAATLAPSFAPSIAQMRLGTPPPVYLGHGPAARRVRAAIHRAIRSHAPVLLVGARGTGKETVARIVHHFGGGEVPSLEIVESSARCRLVSLGAFTYVARLENLPLEEQACLPKLAGLGRVIVGTELRPESPLGRERLHPETVRWASGFRIELPTLAERIEDLELVAMDMVAKAACNRPVGGIADEALDCMRRHGWPGNLDELQEVVGHALREGASEEIELRDLPGRLRLRGTHQARVDSPERQLCLEAVEKQAIRRALAYARGNKRKAARLLRIGKTTLYRKIEQYGLG